MYYEDERNAILNLLIWSFFDVEGFAFVSGLKKSRKCYLLLESILCEDITRPRDKNESAEDEYKFDADAAKTGHEVKYSYIRYKYDIHGTLGISSGRYKRISYKSSWKNKAPKCRIMRGFLQLNSFVSQLWRKKGNNFNENIVSRW